MPSVHFARPVALLIIFSSRAINSLIRALLLVSILGPGKLAGIIAWPQVSLIFIVILDTVIVSEWVSAKVRHAII